MTDGTGNGDGTTKRSGSRSTTRARAARTARPKGAAAGASAAKREENGSRATAATTPKADTNGSRARPAAVASVRMAPPSGPASFDGNGREPARTIVVTADAARLEAAPAATAAVPASLRFRIARIGPWSMFKLSLLFATGTAIVLLGGMWLLYLFLDAAGVLEGIEKVVNQYGIGDHFQFDPGWIFARLAWVAAAMVVIGSLLATCLAAFYNALSDLTGGLDVTLEPHEREQAAAVRSEARTGKPRRRRTAAARRRVADGFGRLRERSAAVVGIPGRGGQGGAGRHAAGDGDVGRASGF